MTTCTERSGGTDYDLYVGARPWTPGVLVASTMGEFVKLASRVIASDVRFDSTDKSGGLKNSGDDLLIYGRSHPAGGLRISGPSSVEISSSSPVLVDTPGIMVSPGSGGPPLVSDPSGGPSTKVLMRRGAGSGAIFSGLGADSLGAWYASESHRFYSGASNNPVLTVTPQGLVLRGTLTDPLGNSLTGGSGGGGGSASPAITSVKIRSQFCDVIQGGVAFAALEDGNPAPSGAFTTDHQTSQMVRVCMRGCSMSSGVSTARIEWVYRTSAGSSWTVLSGMSLSSSSVSGYGTTRSQWVELDPSASLVHGLRLSSHSSAEAFRIGSVCLEFM